MNKTQFNELLAYLHNRPSEAERLRMVLLGESEDCKHPYQQQNLREADQWLTAKEVGEQIGRSRHWVLHHISYLPTECCKQKGIKRVWWLNYPKVKDQLIQMKQQ